jgi:hypothetical protein
MVETTAAAIPIPQATEIRVLLVDMVNAPVWAIPRMDPPGRPA